MDSAKGVSIIICCYNSSTRILPTLEHLQRQKNVGGISWEVVLVDNASSDDTALIAQKIWQHNPITTLKIVKEEKPGLMNARIAGLAHAVYSIISFVDDDNWVEPNWIEKVFTNFSKDEMIGVCGGKCLPAFEQAPPFWFDKYKNDFAVGEQNNESGIINERGYLWGAGISFKKRIWEELKNRGFNNITIGREGNQLNAGEDTELCYAIRLLGYNLYYDENLTLQHYMTESRLRWNYFEKMQVGFGKAAVRLNCYKVLLNKDQFKLKHWLFEYLYAYRQHYKHLLLSLVSFNKEKRLDHKRYVYYWKGVQLQSFKDKGQLNEMVNELKNVFA